MQEKVEALYWSLALQLNLGSAIIKVETSLSTGCPSPATKDLHAELKKTRKKVNRKETGAKYASEMRDGTAVIEHSPKST